MKRLASLSQRTGQPKCEQLIAKAMKSSAVIRLNQAALLAVTPDQGSGGASWKVTAIVSPTVNCSTLPTERQVAGGLRNSGARTKPTTGAASRTAVALPRTILMPSRNCRRDTSGRLAPLPGWPASRLLSFMTYISYPPRQRRDKQRHADAGDDQRTHKAPQHERGGERQRSRPRGRLGQFLRPGLAPAGAQAGRSGPRSRLGLHAFPRSGWACARPGWS